MEPEQCAINDEPILLEVGPDLLEDRKLVPEVGRHLDLDAALVSLDNTGRLRRGLGLLGELNVRTAGPFHKISSLFLPNSILHQLHQPGNVFRKKWNQNKPPRGQTWKFFVFFSGKK